MSKENIIKDEIRTEKEEDELNDKNKVKNEEDTNKNNKKESDLDKEKNELDNKKPEEKVIKNIIDNENLINNKGGYNEENIDGDKKYTFNNELLLPKLISIEKLEQKPEKIHKLTSNKVEVPSLTEEFIQERTIVNNPIQRDINKLNVVKDEILEGLETKEEKPRKEINKININDKIISSNNLDLNNPNYSNKSNINNEYNMPNLPNVINEYPQLNLIEIESNKKDKDENKEEKENEKLDDKDNKKEPEIKEDKEDKEISNKINIPSLCDEVSNEIIIPNNPMRKDIKNLYVIKDIIDENLDYNKSKDELLNKNEINDEDKNKPNEELPEEEKDKLSKADNLDDKKESKDKEIKEMKNIINNENIIKNKIIPSNEENIDNEKLLYNNELQLPSLINIEKLNQKPEKIRKSTSKTVDIPSLSDEILNEHLMPNISVKRDITKPNIIKDELLEELQEKEIKPKKEINKINVIDDIQPSATLDLHSPEYVSKSNEILIHIPMITNLNKDLELIPLESKESIIPDINKNKEELDENKNKDITEESPIKDEDKQPIIQKPEEETEKSKLDNIDTQKPSEEKEIKNIVDNENIIEDKILLSNEEDKNKEKYLDNNELKLPDLINIEKIKQKPERIPKSESIFK